MALLVARFQVMMQRPQFFIMAINRKPQKTQFVWSAGSVRSSGPPSVQYMCLSGCAFFTTDIADASPKYPCHATPSTTSRKPGTDSSDSTRPHRS